MVKTDCNRSKCIYSECNKKKVLKKKRKCLVLLT